MIRTTAIDLCIRYFGKWEEGDDRFSTSSAYSICYFNFKGSSVRAYALCGRESGICRVTLDGETVATVDCRTAGDGEVCVFESDSVTGDAVHNLVLTLMPRGIGEQVGTLTVLGFESCEPIHYPMMLREEMRAELADIECGRRSVTPPEEWCPPTRSVKMPLHNVRLTGGIMRSVFDLNIENLRFNAGLEWYTQGSAPGFIKVNKFVTEEELARPGWAGWAPAQIEASELGGAAGVLRWEEEPELRRVSEEIIGRMKARAREDGYFNYYDEISYDMTCFPEDYEGREMPYKYYAYKNGNHLTERKNADRAFWTRGMMEAINAGLDGADTLVRGMYDWFNRQERYLKKIRYGFNATNGDIGGPMVYHSPIGSPEDILTNMRYYDQLYWMKALTERQPLAMSHYPGERSHSTALLCIQALADMYLATGERKYLDATLGAWDIYERYFKHTGGFPAIIEHSLPYAPGGLEIYKRSKEACGHTNWMWVNERLMQLYPEEEKYIAEIEECVYNTMVNSVQTHSNVYHLLLHGKKEKGNNWNSCCQISVQIAVAALPQYVYTYSEKDTYVNLFIPSEYDSDFGRLTMVTDFPYSNTVSLKVEPKDSCRHTLHIRIPRWASSDMTVLVNGKPFGTGKAGSYLAIEREWNHGDEITFTFPITLDAVLYTGLDQVECGYPRYTFTYGPVLMALDAKECTDESVVPHIPMDIADVLKLTPDEKLHYAIPGTDMTIMPYWDTAESGFSCLPVVAKQNTPAPTAAK